MSFIGPGSIGALNVAGSFAGAQRSSAAAQDELKQNAADRKAQIDRAESAAHSTEDVGETETSPDRDADGRMPFGYFDEGEQQDGSEQSPGAQHDSHVAANRRATDAFGERGGSLDLEA